MPHSHCIVNKIKNNLGIIPNIKNNLVYITKKEGERYMKVLVQTLGQATAKVIETSAQTVGEFKNANSEYSSFSFNVNGDNADDDTELFDNAVIMLSERVKGAASRY